MKTRVTVFVFSMFAVLTIAGQVANQSAPTRWEYYKADGGTVSIKFPKLPILISDQNLCNQTSVKKYAAFSNDVVFGLNIVKKLNEKVPIFCAPKVGFNEMSFGLRLDEIRNESGARVENSKKINSFDVFEVKSTFLSYWLINDVNQQRWFEIWTANSMKDDETVRTFIESFKSGKELSGIDIGEGSARILGDLLDSDGSAKEKPSTGRETSGIKLVIKPAPRYTDLARSKETAGNVNLRVTFLKNGAIGDISVVEALPNGLTEQAIAAAMKIVFIPAKRDGISYNVTKMIQYNFSIF